MDSLVDLPPFCDKEDNFWDFLFALRCIIAHLNGGNQFHPFRVDHFSDWNEHNFNRVVTLENVSIPTKIGDITAQRNPLRHLL